MGKRWRYLGAGVVGDAPVRPLDAQSRSVARVHVVACALSVQEVEGELCGRGGGSERGHTRRPGRSPTRQLIRYLGRIRKLQLGRRFQRLVIRAV